MENATREYLMKILDFYCVRGSSEYLLSKIKPLKDNSLFCCKCSTIFVPKYNADIKSDEKKFTVKCRACSTEYCFNKTTKK